ncbi:hypothetical protein P154DRAFT_576660 [Amniculicola lignicola CBS 123094]|uniref:Uncharacterized protein n=1 Tax=Amniculicola lignicola CBS 123094 TaxID=1392246 RepID=A0A6A5WCY9_9PLEO|nr:hypothetical protein P154DRAFT_576660 [Amniculicola lignicola CBS 123094]
MKLRAGAARALPPDATRRVKVPSERHRGASSTLEQQQPLQQQSSSRAAAEHQQGSGMRAGELPPRQRETHPAHRLPPTLSLSPFTPTTQQRGPSTPRPHAALRSPRALRARPPKLAACCLSLCWQPCPTAGLPQTLLICLIRTRMPNSLPGPRTFSTTLPALRPLPRPLRLALSACVRELTEHLVFDRHSANLASSHAVA